MEHGCSVVYFSMYISYCTIHESRRLTEGWSGSHHDQSDVVVVVMVVVYSDKTVVVVKSCCSRQDVVAAAMETAVGSVHHGQLHQLSLFEFVLVLRLPRQINK